MDDLRLEKTLETICMRIVEQLPDEVCSRCPVVRLLEDVTMSMKEQTADAIGIDTVHYGLQPEEPRRELELPGVTALGRHSLIAYLLHQPVIYAVLWLWFALIA